MAILKLLHVRRFPPPSSRTYELRYIGAETREEGGGNRRTYNNFNNKINKHKWKAAAPHGRLPHTKHKLKSRPGPLSSSTVVTPHLTLPKLLRGTRDRWVVQVSFITNYSTDLAPFPRLSAPPHSPQYITVTFYKIKSYKSLLFYCWKSFTVKSFSLRYITGVSFIVKTSTSLSSM